tara:strand:- start:385 stop:783 length:399 start_codon:yes stop_codon:yes gene_type:complete
MSIKKETWFNFLAAWLILMAGWTVFIKFLFPIFYAINYGEDLLLYIKWDFWWIAHIWLAYRFLNISRYTFLIGSIISFAELIIIIMKLYLFFQSPQWNIWDTNWMINKTLMLILFILISGTLIREKTLFLKS